MSELIAHGEVIALVRLYDRVTAFRGPLLVVEQRREPIQIPSPDVWARFVPGPDLEVAIRMIAESVVTVGEDVWNQADEKSRVRVLPPPRLP